VAKRPDVYRSFGGLVQFCDALSFGGVGGGGSESKEFFFLRKKLEMTLVFGGSDVDFDKGDGARTMGPISDNDRCTSCDSGLGKAFSREDERLLV
jgi:hypothetical protein